MYIPSANDIIRINEEEIRKYEEMLNNTEFPSVRKIITGLISDKREHLERLHKYITQ